MTDVLDELAKEFTQILRTETTSVTAVPAARGALAAILAHKDGASWRADVITGTAKRLGWDYCRETEGGLVFFTFYGQGQHFEGVKHEICQVQILPDRVRFSRRFEFSKSREDVEADYQARGLDPARVDNPGLHPFGLPEEDDMLPAAVILAADHQYGVIVERLREELAKAEQERATAVIQEATAGVKEWVTASASEAGIIKDLAKMRQHHKHYAVPTATHIYEKLPQAYKLYNEEGGRWGPGVIAKVAHLSATTIGRYLKAWRNEGMTEANGVKLPTKS